MIQFWTAREFLIDQQRRLGAEYVDHAWAEKERGRLVNHRPEHWRRMASKGWPVERLVKAPSWVANTDSAPVVVRFQKDM